MDVRGVWPCHHRREGVGGHKPDGRNAEQSRSDGAADERTGKLTLCHRAGHGEYPLKFGSSKWEDLHIIAGLALERIAASGERC